MKVKYDEGAYPLTKGYKTDAGYDIRTPYDFSLRKGCPEVIDTGIHIQIPKGYVGMLKSKSGLNTKDGIIGEGVIDSGYTGSIKVKLYKLEGSIKHFKAGDKIIQLVVVPFLNAPLEEVDELEDTERGDNGFGSTGK